MWHLHTDIHEFYTYTLEDRSKGADVKTSETIQLAERWEGHGAPIPAVVQDQARLTLVCVDRLIAVWIPLCCAFNCVGAFHVNHCSHASVTLYFNIA